MNWNLCSQRMAFNIEQCKKMGLYICLLCYKMASQYSHLDAIDRKVIQTTDRKCGIVGNATLHVLDANKSTTPRPIDES